MGSARSGTQRFLEDPVGDNGPAQAGGTGPHIDGAWADELAVLALLQRMGDPAEGAAQRDVDGGMLAGEFLDGLDQGPRLAKIRQYQRQQHPAAAVR
jgi:hypothetical protein